MPLLQGHSREAISANISELVKNGHDQDQAIAIALQSARESQSKKNAEETGKLPQQLQSFLKDHQAALKDHTEGFFKRLSEVLTPIAAKFAEWKDADHPRGQPDNAGKFGPGGSSTKDLPPHSWDASRANDLLETLNMPGIKIVGSVATKGLSHHDLDVLAPDDFDQKKLTAALEQKGFEFSGQSLLSPQEAKSAKKPFAQGVWSELLHFENPETKQKVEVWHTLPNETGTVGDFKRQSSSKSPPQRHGDDLTRVGQQLATDKMDHDAARDRADEMHDAFENGLELHTDQLEDSTLGKVTEEYGDEFMDAPAVEKALADYRGFVKDANADLLASSQDLTDAIAVLAEVKAEERDDVDEADARATVEAAAGDYAKQQAKHDGTIKDAASDFESTLKATNDEWEADAKTLADGLDEVGAKADAEPMNADLAAAGNPYRLSYDAPSESWEWSIPKAATSQQ